MVSKLIDIYNNKKEVINYLFFGSATTFISLITYFVLTSFLLDVTNNFELQLANVISWIVSIIFAYVTNKKFVFNNKSREKRGKVIIFFITRLVTLFADMIIMYFGANILMFNNKIVKVISQIIIIISNYILSKFCVFNEKCEEM